MGPPVDQLTAESYDLTFGTSVIGSRTHPGHIDNEP